MVDLLPARNIVPIPLHLNEIVRNNSEIAAETSKLFVGHVGNLKHIDLDVSNIWLQDIRDINRFMLNT